MDGLRAGNPKLYNILNNNKFDQGRGLGWLDKQAYRFAKEGNGVRLPLDLQSAAEEYGQSAATIMYRR